MHANKEVEYERCPVFVYAKWFLFVIFLDIPISNWRRTTREPSHQDKLGVVQGHRYGAPHKGAYQYTSGPPWYTISANQTQVFQCSSETASEHIFRIFLNHTCLCLTSLTSIGQDIPKILHSNFKSLNRWMSFIYLGVKACLRARIK